MASMTTRTAAQATPDNTRVPSASITWRVASARIERERITRGWTREQLASAARIDAKTLRDLLSGRRRPTLGTLREVARALEQPLPELITIVESRPRSVPSVGRPVTLSLPFDG